MDLARRILFAVEEMPYDGAPDESFAIEGIEPEVTAYHVLLLYEAGLIDAYDFSHMGMGYPLWIPMRLRWEGHEFVDKIRNDTVWATVKGVALTKSGGLAFETIKIALSAYLDHAIKGGWNFGNT